MSQSGDIKALEKLEKRQKEMKNSYQKKQDIY
jgi:hypothetical protein